MKAHVQKFVGRFTMMLVPLILVSPLFALALVIITSFSQGPTFARVQNDTEHDFEEVVVVTNVMGAVPAGAVSEYHQVPILYADPTVLTLVRNGAYSNQRIMNAAQGYGGLGGGHYTVTLALHGGSLDIRVSKDN